MLILERRVWSFEELRLLGGRLATEDLVTVWESPEALDNLLVPYRVVEEIIGPHLRGESLEQPHGALLVLQVLAVLEGQVQEQASVGGKLPVVSVLDGVPGRLLGQPVRSVHPRVSAVHIAGELVEHDDQGQATPRLVLPALQPPRGGLLVDGLEAVPDLAVELRVLREPALPGLSVPLFALATEPEVEEFLETGDPLPCTHSVRLTTVTSSSRRVVEGRPSRYELERPSIQS